MIQEVEAPKIAMLGNGPYTNRGCEAIVRGSMHIIRAVSPEEPEVIVGSFGSSELIDAQETQETDMAITHVPLSSSTEYAPKGSFAWFYRAVRRKMQLLPGVRPNVRMDCVELAVEGACCALEVGGDNYSLDYGIPYRFMFMDRHVSERGIPIVLWGASVGPFDKEPIFAVRMFSHLRSLAGILVRESLSYEYLRSNDVKDNVWLVADPAFLLEAVEPNSEKLCKPVPPGAIGINLSPLMARFVALDMPQWISLSSEIVHAIAEMTGRSIILVPHVVSPGNDDHRFLSEVREMLPPHVRQRISVSPRELDAAETKWLISQCDAFVGARTHSTIASLSSCVPTLSLAYSVKARGINHDIFGSNRYCIEPSHLTPRRVGEKVMELLVEEAEVRAKLEEQIPKMKQRAYSAGPRLREVIKTWQVACQH